MSEKDVDVKESEEKKVTFNETTEEKNYTKDKELDEEGLTKGKSVAQHAIDNQTNNKEVPQTVVQETAEHENEPKNTKDEDTIRYKTDDEKGDDQMMMKSDNDYSEANNKSDEEKIIKSETDDDNEKKDNTDNGKGDEADRFRFNARNEHEQKLKEEEKENTFENYFHDSAIDDVEVNDKQTAKKETETTDEREDKNSRIKDHTKDYDFNTDEYYENRTRKTSRNESDGEVSIITKKKAPPKQMTIMTDEEKVELKENDDLIRRSDEPKKKSEHRCPSPSTSSSVDSEPHIVTKKKGDRSEEEQRESDRLASDVRKEPARQSLNKVDAKGNKGGTDASPNKTQGADTKTSNKKTNQQMPTPTRTESPRHIAAQARKQNPRMAKSAGPRGRQIYSRTSSTATSVRSPSRWSRPRTCGYREEERRRKEREFFTAELERLKKSLKRDSSKIKKPKPKDHYPYVFTSLEPYYNTYTPQYLIGMPDTGYPEKQPPEAEETIREMKEHRDRHRGEEKELMYTSRCTAIGLTDPWDSLHMDKSVLPKLETSEMRRRRMEKMHEPPRSPSAKQKRPEAKQGSTRLPKFPVISLSNQELATKELLYTDIPMLRDELVRSFSHQEGGRKKDDYTRTRQDFYRMELDRITEMHKNSRPHMRAAYFAYLQNTPGSREAVYQCLRELNKKKAKQTPQAVA